MTTSISEQTVAVPARSEKPKRNKRRGTAKRRPHVAPQARKAGNTAKTVKKVARPAPKATPTRETSKAANVLALLQRPDGATMAELMKATGWQSHSVRGFLSGAVRKKMGMTVTSAKADDGQRTYRVKL
jgi:hypothetical protein